MRPYKVWLSGVVAAIAVSTLFCLDDPTGEPFPPRPDPVCDTSWVADTLAVRDILDSNGMRALSVNMLVGRADIDTCGRIVRLDLSAQTLGGLGGRALTYLSPAIGRLEKLKYLSIGNSQIDSLPTSIGNLRYLAELKAGRCNLTRLPDTICSLDSLSVLYLNDNALARLPQDIGRLTSLVRLELTGNGLDSLPESIVALTGVRQGALTVAANSLCTVSPAMAAWLDTVSYERNAWRSLQLGCAQTATDTAIVRGALDSAGLTSVGVGDVAQIRRGRIVRITLDGRGLTAFPTPIIDLDSLQYLSLRTNMIPSIPRLGALEKLREIDIGVNHIVAADSLFFGLDSLRELRLDSNRLAAPPTALASLDSLHLLDLRSNALDTLSLLGWTLPPSVRELYLSGNAIGRLPGVVGGLRRLEILDISRNAIDSLPPFGGLVALVTLRASDNRLAALPALDSLKSLVALDLARNSLVALPPSVEALRALDTLDVTQNQLDVLPVAIASLLNVKKVRCAGNKLCDPAMSIAVQGWLELRAEPDWRALQVCP